MAQRAISTGQPHKATPLTAMCLAVASPEPDMLAHAASRPAGQPKLRIADPPRGVLPVGAHVCQSGRTVVAEEAIVFRAARRLMEAASSFPTSRGPE
jgi:2-methylaconitate isomerase